MELRVNQDSCDLCGKCAKVCPFGAINLHQDYLEFTAACKLCKICIKQCPKQALYIHTEETREVDVAKYRGVLVVAEHQEGDIHPVTLELLGKGRELADKMGHPLYCVVLGHKIAEQAKELVNYGVNKVFVYDYPELADFRIEPYTNALEDLVSDLSPSIMLVGATSLGRSLAPRIAVRFRTGLTADCTVLDVKENTDLVQIRPAFGGNIMAQIITPKNRPQLATVRYKVMDTAKLGRVAGCEVISRTLSANRLVSKIRVLASYSKREEETIADAEVVIAVGRGIKEQKDLAMVQRLATLLGGKVGVTRPLVEAGWADHTQQIGLSGRTIRPRLLITLGISGAVQFTASIGGAEEIFAINKDPEAPIFNTAHYGIVGDLYEIVPGLVSKLESGGNLSEAL